MTNLQAAYQEKCDEVIKLREENAQLRRALHDAPASRATEDCYVCGGTQRFADHPCPVCVP